VLVEQGRLHPGLTKVCRTKIDVNIPCMGDRIRVSQFLCGLIKAFWAAALFCSCVVARRMIVRFVPKPRLHWPLRSCAHNDQIEGDKSSANPDWKGRWVSNCVLHPGSQHGKPPHRLCLIEKEMSESGCLGTRDLLRSNIEIGEELTEASPRCQSPARHARVRDARLEVIRAGSPK